MDSDGKSTPEAQGKDIEKHLNQSSAMGLLLEPVREALHLVVFVWWIEQPWLTIEPSWGDNPTHPSHFIQMASPRSVEYDHRRIRSIVTELAVRDPPSYPSIDLLRLLFWNCRRAGNTNFKRNLVEIIKTHKPEILVLMEMKVNVRTFIVNSQVIHATVHKEDFEEWLLATVYASPNPNLRAHLWKDLEDMAVNVEQPWLVAGDFNDYASQHEKRSFSLNQNIRRTQKFLDHVNNCNLIDLGSFGPRMTWTNNRQGLANTMER
ncbi:hypothetical protein ACSBR2_041197 [Camellia fascicularis]